MTEDRPGPPERAPWDTVLDVVLFAPLGAAMTLAEELPALAEKGRERLGPRLAAARLVGQFAVGQGRREAERLLRDRLPSRPSPAERPAPEPSGDENRPAPAPAPSSGADEGGAEDLAIPGYDALSASQVVQRLAGLSPAEREAVRAYESAHRGRRTILARVAQLDHG